MKQTPSAARRARVSGVAGRHRATGGDGTHTSMYANGVGAETSSTASAAAPFARGRSSVPRRTSPPRAQRERDDRRRDVDRADASRERAAAAARTTSAAPAGEQRATDRGHLAAPRTSTRPSGGAAQIRDDAAVGGEQRDVRRRRARTYATGHVLVHRMRSVPGNVALHVGVLDPRQRFDPARDRAGVDEQQRSHRCRRRGVDAPASHRRAARPCTRTWSTSSSGESTVRYDEADHDDRARHDEQRDRAAGARPASRLHLDARARGSAGSIVRRRHRDRSSDARSRRGAARARGARRSLPRPVAAPRATSAYDVGGGARRGRRRRSWRASPRRRRRRPAGPCSPHASMSRPAASPGGFVNTEPAFWPPGWCSRRHRTISSMRAGARRRVGRVPAKRRADHDGPRTERRAPVAEPELGRPSTSRAMPSSRSSTTRAAASTSLVSRRGRRRSCAPRRRRDAGDADEELEAAEPGRRRPAGEHRQRDRAAGHDVRRRGRSTSSCSNSPPSTIATPVEPGVGDEQVRAPPDDEHAARPVPREHVGDARADRPRRSTRTSTASGPPQRYVVSAALGRVACRRGRGDARRASRRERRRMRRPRVTAPSQTSGIVVRSPAPSVSTTSPGRAIARRDVGEVARAAGGTRPASAGCRSRTACTTSRPLIPRRSASRPRRTRR